MSMLLMFLLAWVLSPFVLIPLLIASSSRNKKLEKFLRQLLDEHRIYYSEYRNKQTEKAGDPADPMQKALTEFAQSKKSAPSAASRGNAEPQGTFIGPPVPPDMLQMRREKAAQLADTVPVENTAGAQPVSLEKPAAAEQKTAQPTWESVIEMSAENTAEVIPVSLEKPEAVQETTQPAWETVIETPAEQPETTPAAGMTGSFIGPPLPQHLLEQRRAAAQQEPAQTMQTAQPGQETDLSFGSFSGTFAEPAQDTPKQPAPAKKKHTINPASAMLVIGSALIIIAGIIFSTAKWSDMNDWQRTGTIALTAAFFFGVSAVAHKKLKLEDTGMAFYMLGAVFTAITFVTVGYFGLFGNWLSVKGSGFWLLYSFAALLVTLFSAGAVKLYHKGAFVHAVLYGGLCSFTLMSLQLFGDSPDVWALFLNVTAAVPLYLLYKQKLRFGSEMYDDQMKLFTAVLTVIYAVSALPFMVLNIGGWTAPCFLIMLVWIGQAAVYGALLGNDKLRTLHTILTAVTAVELAVSFPEAADETRLLIYGIAVTAAAVAYRYVKPVRSSFSDVLFPLMLFVSFFTARREAAAGGELLACMCLLVGICLMQSAAKEKTDISRGFTAMLPLSVLAADFGAALLITWNTSLSDNAIMAMTAGAVLVQACIFTFVKPVRTLLSDAVFPVSLLVIYSICASMCVSSTDAVMTFIVAAMLLVNVLLHACEDTGKHMVKPYVRALPLAVVVFGQGAAALVNGLSEEYPGDAALAFVIGCVIFAGALVMRFVPRLRTLFSDWFNIIAVITASVCCLSAADTVPGCWFTVGLAAGGIVLTALRCFDKERGTPLISPGVLSAASVYFAAAFSIAFVQTAAYEAYETRQMVSSLIYLLISFAGAFVFMNVERIKSEFSAVMFPLAEMCCAIYISGLGKPSAYLMGMAGFMLMGVIMLIQNSEKELVVGAMRFFMWAPFTGISVCASLAIGAHAEQNGHALYLLFAALFLTVFGLAFRYSKNAGANVRTGLSDLVFAALPSVFAFLCCSENTRIGLWAALAASLLVLANVTEIKPAHSGFVLLSRLQFPCILIIFTAAVSAAMRMRTETPYESIIHPSESELVPNLVFIAMMFAMSVFFMKIRKIRTVFSDFLIPAVLTFAIFNDMYGLREDLRIASFVGMLTLCAMLLMYALEKDPDKHTVVHRFAAPAAMFISVSRLSGVIWSEELPDGLAEMTAFFAGSAAAASAAAMFTYLANKTGEKRFTQSQYAWAVLAGVMLFPAGLSGEACTAALVIGICSIIVCAGVYLLCGRQRRNYAGVIAAAAMVITACDLSRHVSFAAGNDSYYDAWYVIAVNAAVFAVLCVISRLVNGENVLVNTEKRRAVDFAGFAMLAAPFVTLFWYDEAEAVPEEWRRFIAVFEIGIFFLNMIRKGHERRANLTMLTFASAMGCLLIYVRPFLLTDNDTLRAKINLLPLILFSILVKMIWKEDRKLASDLSFVVQLAAFAVLLFDALTHQSLGNTILVLCVTLTIMLVSFAAKSGRWFAISSASFLGLTIYITRGFVGRVEWWVYLLTAGLVLIAVASVNEYMKSRGQTLKDAGRHFLSRWKKQ